MKVPQQFLLLYAPLAVISLFALILAIILSDRGHSFKVLRNRQIVSTTPYRPTEFCPIPLDRALELLIKAHCKESQNVEREKLEWSISSCTLFIAISVYMGALSKLIKCLPFSILAIDVVPTPPNGSNTISSSKV